jgi:hypothetical protein
MLLYVFLEGSEHLLQLGAGKTSSGGSLPKSAIVTT